MLTYFKLGYLEFLRNLKVNLLIVLELTAVLVMAIFTVSSVMSQLRFYLTFEDTLNSDGFVARIGLKTSSRVSPDKQILSNERIFNVYNQVDDVISLTSFSFEADSAEYSVSLAGKGYDERIINKYKPLLKEGKWLSEADDEKGVLHIVVSKNFSNVKTGDEYSAVSYSNEGKEIEYKIKVIGETVDGASIFNRLKTDSNAAKIDDFFENYYVDEIHEPYALASQKELNELKIVNNIDQTSFVSVKDGTSQKDLDELKSGLIAAGGAVDMSVIKSNSLKEVKTNLIFLMPIIIGVLLFVIVTTICMSAINDKKQLRSYGIYYTCGSRWRQCILISVFSSLITAIIACVISALVLVLAQSLGFLEETVIEFGLWQAVACVAVLVLNLITSVIMPIIIIGRTQPREIIKSNE